MGLLGSRRNISPAGMGGGGVCDMKTTISIELEFTIDFDATPYEPMTLVYPGNPADVEPYDLSVLGVRVSDNIFDAILKEHDDDIRQACWDELQEDAVAAAEHRLDCIRDR